MKQAKACDTRENSSPRCTAGAIFPPNDTSKAILLNALTAAISLFLNGIGVFLTIHADIGAGPWDVFNLGLSQSFGILYGTASIFVSLTVLMIDILMKEPVGIAMFIDAVVVGKTVDLIDRLNIIPKPGNVAGGVGMMLFGLVIMGYTQFLYMRCALGCGPRDTLMVGVKRRLKRVPIGVVSMVILSAVTLAGYLLGGPVGIGTLICALCAGPIMQFAFHTVHFDAAAISHQRLQASLRVLLRK